ncbi:MAG TPA: hypothetical protein ENI80_06020, partial [Acidiferrobacteraceae bacterium]|nr:hypothetical protein [Acidiferrobacteraceae bacterium]
MCNPTMHHSPMTGGRGGSISAMSIKSKNLLSRINDMKLPACGSCLVNPVRSRKPQPVHWGRFAVMGLLLCMLLPFQPSYAAPKPVATAVYVYGMVTATAAGQPSRALIKGAPLFKGDILSTGSDSFTVISFVDKARMTLRPHTQLRIDDYAYSSKTARASMNLLKGGLRVLTGLIGKRKPAAYRINTPTATIGIRGTVFDVRMCGQDCADESRKLGENRTVPTGLYVPVYEHAIWLGRAKQKLSVKRGETGRVVAQKLKRLDYIPRFLSQDKYPRPDLFDPSVWPTSWRQDQKIDVSLRALRGPVLQSVFFPPTIKQGAPDWPLYKQEPPAAQGDFSAPVAMPTPTTPSPDTGGGSSPPSVSPPSGGGTT